MISTLSCAHLLVEAELVMKEVEKGVCFEREQEKTSFCVTLRSPPKEHNTYGTLNQQL